VNSFTNVPRALNVAGPVNKLNLASLSVNREREMFDDMYVAVIDVVFILFMIGSRPATRQSPLPEFFENMFNC